MKMPQSATGVPVGLGTGWGDYKTLLLEELNSLAYEQIEVPEALRQQIISVPDEYEAIIGCYRQLAALPEDPTLTRQQPDELEAIRALRPEGVRKLPVALSDEEMLDKLHGGWVGRAVGCAMGKPVESFVFLNKDNLPGHKHLEYYLRNRKQWPLTGYISGKDVGDGYEIYFPETWDENICCMTADDDMHYPLVALRVLEEHGMDFVWYQVADCWNRTLPYGQICTAETQAILNYNTFRSRIKEPENLIDCAAFTRRNNNPYREWIGALIRADIWAYAVPGQPERAAELAWRDASWTHCANGIYGEMFIAAMISAAFVESDLKRLVEIGLSEIPAQCKLAIAVKTLMEKLDNPMSFEEGCDWIRSMNLPIVHTVNNALLVILALYFGKWELGKSAGLSVMGALDTDCVAATVGSIIGVVKGYKAIEGTLTEKLHDRLIPDAAGFADCTFHDLAIRTQKVQQLA